MNSIVKQPELATDIGETTAVSWSAPAAMDYNQWESIGKTLQQLGRSLNFWLGDWLVQGEIRFGEQYAQAIEMTGLAQETLSKYKSVAERLPAGVRRADLTWTSHFAVAYSPEHLRGPLLEITARFELHTRDLKDIMRLKPPQLEALVAACDDDDEMDFAGFRQALNDIRLTVQAQSMIAGKATAVTDMPEYKQATLSMEAAAPPSRAAGGNHLSREVYMEEIFEFFEAQGAVIKQVTVSGAAWEGGITVRAAIDATGKAYLIWETADDA